MPQRIVNGRLQEPRLAGLQGLIRQLLCHGGRDVAAKSIPPRCGAFATSRRLIVDVLMEFEFTGKCLFEPFCRQLCVDIYLDSFRLQTD